MELQPERNSFNSWTGLIRNHSAIRIQDIRSQNSTVVSEIEDRMGLKWSPTSKQAATLDTKATSIAEDKLAIQLSKCWEIESYATNCDVTVHFKDEQRAIKTLEQKTRFTGERDEVGFL